MTPWWQQYPEDLADPMRDAPEPPDGMMACPSCKGSGQRNTRGDECRDCAGTGVVDDEREAA